MNIKNPELIMWDWDNTLVNSRPIVVAALEDVAQKAHLKPITYQDVVDVMGTHMGRFWRENFGDAMIDAISYYLTRYVQHSDKLELFPETLDVLSWVQSKGIPQMVISNKRQNILDEECDRLGLRHYFKQVVGTDESRIAKPMPEFADSIFGDDKPVNALMIGDGESDMLFSHVLGCFGLFIRPKEMEVSFQYDDRVSDLSEAFQFLKKQLD